MDDEAADVNMSTMETGDTKCPAIKTAGVEAVKTAVEAASVKTTGVEAAAMKTAAMGSERGSGGAEHGREQDRANAVGEMAHPGPIGCFAIFLHRKLLFDSARSAPPQASTPTQSSFAVLSMYCGIIILPADFR